METHLRRSYADLRSEDARILPTRNGNLDKWTHASPLQNSTDPTYKEWKLF